MDQKVSVIIPMYNVAPYLANCLDSLTKQTYKNLDIVLVNDGSTDLTGEIAYDYQAKDERIQVIDIENGGASNARNIGLQAACGDYLIFIDADDTIRNNAIELLYQTSQETEADVVIGRVQGTTQQNYQFSNQESKQIEVWNNEQCLKELLRTEKTSMFPVAKLMRKEIVADLTFDPSLKLAEDALFLTQLYLQQPIKTVFVNQVVYAYLQRAGSATKSMDLSFVFDTITVYQYINQHVMAKYPLLKQELINRKNWANLEVYDKLVAYGNSKDTKCLQLEKEIKSSYWQILTDPLFTKNRKLALTILLLNRNWYQNIVKRKKGAK